MKVLDLLIIGGGMSGISVAHFFRDQNILLLEKGELLSGASGHNAGFLISGFGEHFARTAQRLGDDLAREILDFHLASHHKIAQLAKQIPDACYKQTGSFAAPVDPCEQTELLESYHWLRKNLYSAEWIPEANLGLYKTTAALFNPADARIDSIYFWKKLAEGLPVQTQCEVHAVYSDRGMVFAETNKQRYAARNVVYCLNAFAAQLLPQLQGRYIPLRGQMLELSLASAPPTCAPIYMDHGEIYWRFAPDRLIFGGLEYLVPEEEVGISTEVSSRILSQQMEWINRHFHKNFIAPGIRPLRAWASTMAFTVDGFPFVGPLREPNQYLLSGLCGLGYSYAMEAASRLHELITSGKNRIPSFCSSDRINSLPVYRGGNWRVLYEAWNH